MRRREIIVSAWRGGTYGIRISMQDRGIFKREWREVILLLDGKRRVRVRISDSFWRRCPELRSKHIGEWLREKGLIPWPKGSPPKLILRHREDNIFELYVP